MKKFLIKSSIIFIFSLLFFRFTFISIINHYENKLSENISSENIKNQKIKLFENLKNLTKKDKILHDEDAKILSDFIKKLMQELNIINN